MASQHRGLLFPRQLRKVQNSAHSVQVGNAASAKRQL